MALDNEAIRQFLEGGWSGFDEPREAGTADEASRQVYDSLRLRYLENTRIKRLFDTPDGKWFLENILRQWTIERATFDPQLRVNPEAMGFFRSGENNIYFRINSCIEEAKKGPPTAPEGDSDDNELG